MEQGMERASTEFNLGRSLEERWLEEPVIDNNLGFAQRNTLDQQQSAGNWLMHKESVSIRNVIATLATASSPGTGRELRQIRIQDGSATYDFADLYDPYHYDSHKSIALRTDEFLKSDPASPAMESSIASEEKKGAVPEISLFAPNTVEPHDEFLRTIKGAMPDIRSELIDELSTLLQRSTTGVQPERSKPVFRTEQSPYGEAQSQIDFQLATMVNYAISSTKHAVVTSTIEKSSALKGEDRRKQPREERLQLQVGSRALTSLAIGKVNPLIDSESISIHSTISSQRANSGTSVALAGDNKADTSHSLIDAIKDGYDRLKELQRDFPDYKSPKDDPERNGVIRHDTWNKETLADLIKAGVDPYLATSSLFAWGVAVEAATFASRSLQSLLGLNQETIANLANAGLFDVATNANALSAGLAAALLDAQVKATCDRMESLSCGLMDVTHESQYSLGVEGLESPSTKESNYSLGIDYDSIASGEKSSNGTKSIEGGADDAGTGIDSTESNHESEKSSSGNSVGSDSGGRDRDRSSGGQSGGNQGGGEQSSGGSCNTGKESGSAGGQCTTGGSEGGLGSGGGTGGGSNDGGGSEGGGESEGGGD